MILCRCIYFSKILDRIQDCFENHETMDELEDSYT